GDGAPAAPRTQHDFATECQEAQRQLRAGIGMGDRAANGAAIARLVMADPGQRQRQQRRLVAQGGAQLERRLRHRSTDDQRALLDADLRQPREAADIDEELRAGEAHVEHGHERLAAGEDARVAAELGERCHRLLWRVRPEIVEARWLHRANPRSPRRRRSQPVRDASPPARATRAWKNWAMSSFATPSSMRPPTEATLPPISAS